MAPASRLFQASFSAALLRSTALVIALLVLTSPVHAEAVTLICQTEAGFSFTLGVDYDRKIVGLLRSDGTAYFSAPATITAGDVKWNAVLESYGGESFTGYLNRLTSQFRVSSPERDGRGVFSSQERFGTCRRATQKF